MSDDAARARVEVAWERLLPPGPGRDARAILEAAAARSIDVLFVIGCDPLRDFPDAALARRAMDNAPYKVVIDTAEAGMGPFADAVLPAAAVVERDGRFTDWEGRSQPFHRIRPAPGLAVPDWEILTGLARACGHDLGFRSIEDVRAEMTAMDPGVSGPPARRDPDPGRPAVLGEADPG